jgi:hypothetical protein
MVEVIVASVIFITATAGVMSTIGLTATPAINNEAKTKGAVFGKKVFNSLSKEINSNVASGLLSVGSHTWPNDPDFPGYTATYIVSMSGVLRKVDVSVTW